MNATHTVPGPTSRLLYLLSFLLLLNSCLTPPFPPEEKTNRLPRKPEIYPDYAEITIPPNIAPLNFIVKESGKNFIALFKGADGTSLKLHANNSMFRIPEKEWKKLLVNNHGSEIEISIFREEKESWEGFSPIRIQIASYPIDPYLVYRLIPPGYRTWTAMGLYQRDLTTFKESPVIENKQINNSCVNCHSFCKGSSENMMFHLRGPAGGTMIKTGKEVIKVNLKTDETESAGIYPSWHPSAKYIAFSTRNNTTQYFHASTDKTIEVLDKNSDLVLYNTVDHTLSHVPGTRGDRYMETYPCWSPDGRHLYFSRSGADKKTPFDSIRYDICRIEFNPQSGRFGQTETVLEVSKEDQSASFPRISPDGNYLLCTIHNYGTFPIWHKEADLCLIELQTGRSQIIPVNSDNTESFHTWSSNSKWVVFSSRRDDGRYTRLYISHMNDSGEFQKPFLLPQRNPGFYESLFYSYNVPELVSGAIQINPRRWRSYATQGTIQAVYK